MSPTLLPLATGLQTELDEHLVTPGATLLMENMVSPQTGKARVRFGSDVLSTSAQATLPSGGTLPVPWQLATLGGSLVRFNRAPVPLHVWASGPSAWVAPVNTAGGGGVSSYFRGPIKVDTTPVFSGAQVGELAVTPTVAVSSSAIVVVYATRSGSSFGTCVVILDRATRRPLFSRQTGTVSKNPRVRIVSGMAIVAYEAGGALTVDRYNLTTYAFAQTVTLGAIAADSPIDIREGSPVVGASNVGILYTDGSNVLQCATVDATNLSTNSTFAPRTTASATVTPTDFGWMQDLGAGGRFAIMMADAVSGLRVLWNLPAPTAGFSDAVATHVLDAAATSGVRNIIGTTVGAGATGQYRVLVERTGATDTRRKIEQWTWAGSSATAQDPIYSVGIRSKLWRRSADVFFVAAFGGEDQRSYYVMPAAFDTSQTTYTASQATILPRDAGGLTETDCSASDVDVGPDNEIYAAVTSELRIESIDSGGTATGGTTRMLAIEIVRVRHALSAETEAGKPVEFIRSLFVPGGTLGMFDGSAYASACFPYYPPHVAAVAVTGGQLEATATYRWRVVYSFVDRNGRKWRSAPSTPVSADTTGSDLQFEITVEPLRIIDRGVTGVIMDGGFQIEIYRTQADATAGFFLVASIANDPTLTAQTVTITDNVADASLGEQLYTDGNGLENQSLPPILWCVEHQGRLICGEAGTGTIWYSTEADFTNGLIFNEALTFDVGDPSEPTTGGAVYNEQLFVFKAGKSYLVGGVGANPLGQGQTYYPRLIDGGIGCVGPQTIAVADDGVWFRSGSDRAGIHRTTGGTPEYVGLGVRAYDSLTITSAVVVRSKTEIRFYTFTGRTLVWNWTTKQWGTNTSQPCWSATVGYAGTSGAVYARATDDAVMAESTTLFTEGAVSYSGKVRSPWYQFGGPGGWGRARRWQGYGAGGSAHTTTIRLYKGFSATPFKTASFGFDGTRTKWDWEIRPPQQKDTAMMVEVEITAPALGVMTAGPDIVGVNLIPIVKEGADKLPASRRT